MTGGKDSGSGTSVEHNGTPPRTETDPMRTEQPTLPDGMVSSPSGIESLSAGTLDVSDAVGDDTAGNVVAASDDDADDITGPKQPPFSGFWFEDADIEDTNVDDPEVQAQVSTQRALAEEPSASTEDGPEVDVCGPGLPSEYVGPELATAPRFDDDTALDSTPLEAVPADSAPEPSVPSAPSLEQLGRRAKPIALDDEELKSDVDDLDGELGELLATHGLALGDPPKDLSRDGLFDASTPTSPEQLADAVDDDQTDPQVPSARRNSDRPPRAAATPMTTEQPVPSRSPSQPSTGKQAKVAGGQPQPAESVAPPAVSVTLRPSAGAAPSQPQKEGNSRELWLAAAVVVGFAAAAAIVVLVGAQFLDSGATEKAATAVDVVFDPPRARPAAVPLEATAQQTAEPVAATGTETSVGELPPNPNSLLSPAADAPSPKSIAERMQPATGESPGTGSQETSGASETEDSPQDPMLSPFDRDAAYNALEVVAVNASNCRQPGDPTGQARLTVTFSPSSGRVTQATVSGKPFRGTATGSCIARFAQQATVPPYAGSYTTVHKTISVR